MSAVKSLHIFYRADYSDLLCTESIEEALDSLDLIKYHIYRIQEIFNKIDIEIYLKIL